jgi:anti-sigma B factor antagonist/stage II sporulation protein AA (anti-sigma F factor antagonist)
MKFTANHQGNTLILESKGRIDHASAEAFSAALTPYLADCKTDGNPLILDFSQVEYVSSIGLRALMLAARQVKTQGGQIAIAAATPLVREVFEVCRFNLVISLYDCVNTALANFAVE